MACHIPGLGYSVVAGVYDELKWEGGLCIDRKCRFFEAVLQTVPPESQNYLDI